MDQSLAWYRLAGKRVRHARGGARQIKAGLGKGRLLQSARLRCAMSGS